MKKLSIDLENLKKRRRELIVPVALMAGLLATIFIVVQLLGSAERVVIDEPVYQYVFEERDEYTDGIVMKKTEDTVMIDYGHQTVETDGCPFYYTDQDKLILSDDFLYLQRNGDIGGLVSYFTTLTANGDGTYTLADGTSGTLTGGMLHDGGDVFIFLEDATVSWNGETKDITGFSYVTCYQGESILIWSYGDEEAVWEELDGDGATVMMENGIDVDLVNDIYYKANGTKFLLYTDPTIFDPVKTQ